MQRSPEMTLVRCAADWRSLLPGASAGILQLMYPPLGRGVMEHSAFVDDPFGRVYRSIPQIWATVLSPDADRRGRHIRDLHRDIGGTDDSGARYHALDPETFWWAHATFTWEMFRSVELFHRRPLTSAERHHLYADTVEWYARYRVSMRPVPADLPAFEARFAAVCADELELTPAARHAIDIALAGDLGLPLIPPSVMRAFRPVLKAPGRAVALGCLPAEVRRRFGIPWSTADRRTFRLLIAGARQGFAIVPEQVNRRTLDWSLRQVGARTRHERYRQPA